MSRVFPIRTEPDDDPRFSFGLALEVARVLAAHGYPDLTDPTISTAGCDFVALQEVLYRFIYVGPEETP